MVSADLFEFNLSEETVKEHFEEDQEVTVLFTDFLHPLNINLIGNLFKSILHLWQLKISSQRIDIITKVNEEPNFLFKFFSEAVDKLAPHFLRIVT